MSHKRNFYMALRIAWAPTHADTRLGCALFCRIAEAVAPGFTEQTDRQIAARLVGDQGENNLGWAEAIHLAAFRKKWMFIHNFLLWIGCLMVERHDPCAIAQEYKKGE